MRQANLCSGRPLQRAGVGVGVDKGCLKAAWAGRRVQGKVQELVERLQSRSVGKLADAGGCST